MKDNKELNTELDACEDCRAFDDGDCPGLGDCADAEDDVDPVPSDYFKAEATSDGVSGDDVNRRLREARLGHAAPSADWEQCHNVVHCIYKDQVPTKTLHDVVLYNFLPTVVLGFVAESIVETLGLTEPDCECGREDCESCNTTPLDSDGDPVIPSLDEDCTRKGLDCHICMGCVDDRPPSLTPVTVDTLKRMYVAKDPVLAFKETQSHLDVAGGRVEKAYHIWEENHIMCKHYVAGTCHQAGDVCTFNYCPRLNHEGLDY